MEAWTGGRWDNDANTWTWSTHGQTNIIWHQSQPDFGSGYVHIWMPMLNEDSYLADQAHHFSAMPLCETGMFGILPGVATPIYGHGREVQQ